MGFIGTAFLQRKYHHICHRGLVPCLSSSLTSSEKRSSLVLFIYIVSFISYAQKIKFHNQSLHQKSINIVINCLFGFVKLHFCSFYLVVYVHVWGEEGGVLVSLCKEVVHFCSNILINTVLIIFPLLHSYYYSQSLITQHNSLRYLFLLFLMFSLVYFL